MIDVILEYQGGIDARIVSAVPALPRSGDSFHFVDTDREIDLLGEVDYVKFEEVDGDTYITIVII